MNKTEIIVPARIRFINEWKEFDLLDFPYILDKKIPGCGFTEYCITNSKNVILASPRKILLENKEAQHPNDVLLIKNKLDKTIRVDKTLERKDTMQIEDNISEDEKLQIISDLQKQIISYVMDCMSKNIPIKILVTYDSYRLVKDILQSNNVFDNFYTVIDEFQSIFTDSRFKADTELEFVNNLSGVNKVCFVSATPMIEKYLDELDEFKNLPYYELNWEKADPFRVNKPNLKVRSVNSRLPVINKIVESYRTGNYEKAVIQDDSKLGYHYIESKEAVFYVNSVSNIQSIIRKCNIKPNEVNILCANTPENVKKLGKKYPIGSVPLPGETHKMFTFCTRTVYLGADFYSDNARSFILSDANIETLAVDITLDLPQILGRQRLDSNPWKNKAELYYKTLSKKNVVLKDEFEKILKRKIKETDNLEKAWNICVESSKDDEIRESLANKFLDSIRLVNYRRDYASINRHAGNVPVFARNKLVLIAERRAYDIQQIDYKDRFSVFNTIYSNNNYDLTDKNMENVNNFISDFDQQGQSYMKLKYLCENNNKLCKEELDIVLDIVPKSYSDFYKRLGPEGCRKRGYNFTKLKKAIGINEYDKDDLKQVIQNSFKIGDVVSRSDMKICLQAVYDKLGFNKKAKSSDIEEYFDTILTNAKDRKGILQKSYRLINKKN